MKIMVLLMRKRTRLEYQNFISTKKTAIINIKVSHVLRPHPQEGKGLVYIERFLWHTGVM